MRKAPNEQSPQPLPLGRRQPLFRLPRYPRPKRALTRAPSKSQDNPDEKKAPLKSGSQAVQLEIKSDPAPYRRGKRPASTVAVIRAAVKQIIGTCQTAQHLFGNRLLTLVQKGGKPRIILVLRQLHHVLYFGSQVVILPCGILHDTLQINAVIFQLVDQITHNIDVIRRNDKRAVGDTFNLTVVCIGYTA